MKMVMRPRKHRSPEQIRREERTPRVRLSPTEKRELAAAVRRLRDLTRGPVAVFLGAGASKPFGYPLTAELLTKIVTSLGASDFLKVLPGEHAKRHRERLRRYLLQLMPGESLRLKNLPLVTSLLSMLDYSIATGQSVMAERSMDEIRQARRLLERAVLEVIAEEDPFSGRAGRLLLQFSDFLKDLRTEKAACPLGVITTNYDMAADEAVFEAAGIGVTGNGLFWVEDDIAAHIDFGFRWLQATEDLISCPRPPRPRACLLKLHGSTNWLRCPLCDNIYINHVGAIWKQAYRGKTDHLNRCHCSRTKLEAQIVSPSFVREMREPNLLGAWKTALDVLRDAREWVIIGYSFPDEDLGVRALFTRAYGSRTTRPHITVVQRDAASRNRYSAFFEPGRLSYCVGGLEVFVKAWKEA
jgi:hypothetical protein